jgi:hypothetical protein
MSPPIYLITAFIGDRIDQVYYAAQTLHGVRVPDATIAE